jgi:hypothetical protein
MRWQDGDTVFEVSGFRVPNALALFMAAAAAAAVR